MARQPLKYVDRHKKLRRFCSGILGCAAHQVNEPPGIALLVSPGKRGRNPACLKAYKKTRRAARGNL